MTSSGGAWGVVPSTGILGTFKEIDQVVVFFQPFDLAKEHGGFSLQPMP
jgi:hypothetical protein